MKNENVSCFVGRNPSDEKSLRLSFSDQYEGFAFRPKPGGKPKSAVTPYLSFRLCPRPPSGGRTGGRTAGGRGPPADGRATRGRARATSGRRAGGHERTGRCCSRRNSKTGSQKKTQFSLLLFKLFNLI